MAKTREEAIKLVHKLYLCAHEQGYHRGIGVDHEAGDSEAVKAARGELLAALSPEPEKTVVLTKDELRELIEQGIDYCGKGFSRGSVERVLSHDQRLRELLQMMLYRYDHEESGVLVDDLAEIRQIVKEQE